MDLNSLTGSIRKTFNKDITLDDEVISISKNTKKVIYVSIGFMFLIILNFIFSLIYQQKNDIIKSYKIKYTTFPRYYESKKLLY